EPISIQIRRKAALLRDYGYAQDKHGLYTVKATEEEDKLMLIERLNVDVLTKRHVFTVPDLLTEKPKEQGVVLLTQLTSVHDSTQTQVLEIYRSDMLSKQPRFFEQIHAVKPPHK